MNFFVVTLFGFFLAVQASPLVEPRATLDVWDPTIIFPNKLTEWHPGGKEIVTWSVYDKPPLITGRPSIYLNLINPDNSLIKRIKLAEGFNLSSGFVFVTVPTDIKPGKCDITLFGDSGNVSPDFFIVP